MSREDQAFTSVGYGAQSVTVNHGPASVSLRRRPLCRGTSDKLLAITKAWLRISMNPSHGDAGTCYGDSGGPKLLGAAAWRRTSLPPRRTRGDTMCRATNVVYRLDTDSARMFLGQYVTLP